ncbi:MAG TPA: hypothetical protein G4O00_08235 [Thermoflexia bacterium]|jgi:hypothetical protein|nr:hypothetical protein [Thermoflexia bacterium]
MGTHSKTERLLLIVTIWEAVLVALVSPLSATGPLAGLRVADWLGLDEAGRVGRIVMLYHSLAVPFVAALVYLVLDLFPVAERRAEVVRSTVTAGYVLTSLGGIGFAYLGGGWIAHGLFLVGLSLVFYAGAVLAVGLVPWRVGGADDPRSYGSAVERWALWLTVLYTLITAAIGGATASFFGNGFEAFLAEDVLRVEHNLGHKAIIAHLHAMLMLIDIVILIIVGRTFRLDGTPYRVAMWLTIVGGAVATFATWSVMVIEFAHKIINVGVFLLLIGGGTVAVQGLARLIRERQTEGVSGLRALLTDPVRFGMLFELLFVNVVVTAPGLSVAFNLEMYRQPEYLEVERAIAVGHWHVLATLSAVIVLFLVVDRLRVRGWLRRLVGWGVLVGSSLAFIFVQFYMLRRPGEDPGWTIPFIDAGVALFLVALAIFLGVQLARLLNRRREEAR